MVYIKSLLTVFSDSLMYVWDILANFAPTLILAIILFIIGMVVASIVGKAIAQLINTLKIDKLFESAGAEEVLNRMGWKLNIGKFFGVIVKWFIAFVFLMASLQIVKLTQVSQFIGQMLQLYLPAVIITAVVLIIATIIADTTKRVVIASAKAANISSANSLGAITKYAIWIFAFMIVLPQFGVGENMIMTLFQGIVAVFAIAGGLAFGLGGKDAAARAIDNIQKDMSSINKIEK
jgi:hypothetical protein